MQRPLLLTIAPSHYCEKARWALDRLGIDYREEVHVPLFHRLANRRVHARKSVPVLVDLAGVFDDSTAILHHLDEKAPADKKLYPADLRAEAEHLEDEYDEQLGPHTRRLAYWHVLPQAERVMDMLGWKAPSFEVKVARAIFPLLRGFMRQAMRIDAEGARRSREKIDRIFASVAQRLSDGRTYLCGDRFTAADLTFASLAAPAVAPAEYGVPLPSPETLSADLRAEVDRYRATPAGAFVLRLYRENR